MLLKRKTTKGNWVQSSGLVHVSLQCPGGDLVLFNDEDNDAHARESTRVHSIPMSQEVVSNRCCVSMLISAGTTDYKVIIHHEAANDVQRGNERLKDLQVQSSNDRLRVVGAKPFLMQVVGHCAREGERFDLPTFLQRIQVQLELEVLSSCLDIGGLCRVCHPWERSSSGSLWFYHLGLDPKTPVHSDGHTVLSLHGHDSPSVIGHNRHDCTLVGL